MSLSQEEILLALRRAQVVSYHILWFRVRSGAISSHIGAAGYLHLLLQDMGSPWDSPVLATAFKAAVRELIAAESFAGEPANLALLSRLVDEPDRPPLIRLLAACQNIDGGWGFSKGRRSSIPATCHVLLNLAAIEECPAPDVAGAGIAWLRQAWEQEMQSGGPLPFKAGLTCQVLGASPDRWLPGDRRGWLSEAREYLQRTQAVNGGWASLRAPVRESIALKLTSVLDTAMIVAGLATATPWMDGDRITGGSGFSTLSRAVEFLVSRQDPEGFWVSPSAGHLEACQYWATRALWLWDVAGKRKTAAGEVCAGS